ncbi:ComEA family DNA-binding protein [Terrilactibacillus sp. BCM23-1]|uniref:ComEA family DNA-binding protein n=1 Tax=Terrilactibacillus tamarindi TaxID=2599694 RepID=A0A6N8CR18_9BACI|nr:helix-hairpin-helix domain-containing protein [Terrilactibacillus tamarindi]MTT32491.1 ComEA family DNA-binding protein [Terrilactibacillus tamarindi]
MNKLKIVIGACLAIAILVVILFINKHPESSIESDSLKEETFQSVETTKNVAKAQDNRQETKATDTSLVVDLKGEVKHPGVYKMENGSRVSDVIQKSGGYTNQADQNKINLAQKLKDEMVILVPKKGDSSAVMTTSNSTANSDSSASTEDSKLININTATMDELQNLNGIGPSKAEAIISYREEHGLFKTPEELTNVTGIGEKSFEKLKSDICVE